MTDAGILSQRAARLIGRLKTRKGRGREAPVLVEGIRTVTTALEGGADFRFAVTSPGLTARPGGIDLAARLRAMGADIRVVPDRELADLSDTEQPQGVLLVCEERESALEALPAGRWLVLDAVQDPGNAGTLLRAAAAFGLDGVVALEGTVDLWSPKAVRASAGLVFHVPVARAAAGAFLIHCNRAGVTVLVADAGGEDVHHVELEGPFALVMGNEGAGARPAVVEGADRRVSVPMRGPAESLNVGIAGSILLYALTGEERLG